MTTKEAVLTYLEDDTGTYVSGEELAERLSISRAAVWKAVKALRSEGYIIDSVRNKGYSLSSENDILSAGGIKRCLEEASAAETVSLEPVIRCKRTVTSTNTILKEMAAAGEKEGLVLAASCQTEGKGRVGRRFYSPDKTGLYLSILLRPAYYDAARAAHFTTMAAVAACEAIESITDSEAQIKWVNDVYMQGRKVAGILTEASVDLESGFLDYAVLGIGFNVYAPEKGFPEEFKDRAGYILDQSQRDAKNRLAAAFIHRFLCFYDEERNGSPANSTEAANALHYVHEYRKRCFVVGRSIDVLIGGRQIPAQALAVDNECRLLVRYEDGREELLSSGEVSIRV